MTSRAFRFALLGVLAGCSRTSEAPQPKAVAEPAHDASTNLSAADAGDAGARANAPPSPFTIIARAPTSDATAFERPTDALARPMPFVQRLPGGGLVIASEYARAHADGPGALIVELVGRGLEGDVLYRPSVVQGAEGVRWVWSDAALSVIVAESETGRNGPRLVSYKSAAKGFQVLQPSVGYWSAVVRGDSVLALQRTAYEIPNSSIYPKGSGYEQNNWGLKPARIAVLSGKAVAPSIPAGLCPTAMSAAQDGALVVAVEKCTSGPDSGQTGALRFAPGAANAKLDWFPQRNRRDSSDPDPVVVFAASESELYVADGDRLSTWNGREWAHNQPFENDSIGSLSRSPSGELWAVLKDSRRIMKRSSADGTTWTRVTLPSAPIDPLDEQAYALPNWEFSEFLKVDALPENQELRHSGGTAMIPCSVDATAEEVVVVASIDHEAFVLSTKPRTPIARLPSIGVQRAKIAQTLKREVATSDAQCKTKSFLVFAETATAQALRAALGDAGAAAGDAGKDTAKIGEAIVEGQKRLVVYGEPGVILAAAKRLATLNPKRVCGPAVLERSL